MRTPALVALAAAALLVTACADATDGAPAGTATPLSNSTGPTAFPTSMGPSASSATPAPTVSASTARASASSVTPTASSTFWSLSTARTKYLDYVAPYNAAVKKLDAVVASKTSTAAEYRDNCAAIAGAQATFSDRLLAGNWPASVRPALIDFVPLIEKSIAGFRLCAEKSSVTQAQAVLKNLPDTATAANRVRVALGLPKVK